MLAAPRGDLLLFDLDFAILHADIGEMLTDKRQRLCVPQLSNSSVVSLSNEEDGKADDKESHEAAFHSVGLGKHYWIEGLAYCNLFRDILLKL